MKKAAGKRTTTRKKKVGSLPARGSKTDNVKGGGFSIGKLISTPISAPFKAPGATM